MLWVISGRILEREATLDPLTQAYNRQGFDWKLASQGEKETTVIMLDIDDFKSINDVFGHQTGDAVLVQLTRNLQKYFGPKAIIGRNGGDEFVVALPGRMSDNRPAIKGLSVLKQEAASNGEAIPFSVSIGYSEFPGQAKDYEEALKFADAALYEVKIAGKKNFASYKSSLTEKKHHNQLGLGLRALAAGDPTPLLVMQMDTKEAIYVNKSLLELFGCELSSEFYDYYGQSLLNLISPGDQARVKEEFTDFVESAVDEERFRGDCQILTADARTLGALAMTTDKIVLGSAGFILPERNPIHVAQAAVSIDRLSNHRFLLGLVSGDRKNEFKAFGRDWNERSEIFREGWDLTKKSLTHPNRLHFSGNYYSKLTGSLSVVPQLEEG